MSERAFFLVSERSSRSFFRVILKVNLQYDSKALDIKLYNGMSQSVVDLSFKCVKMPVIFLLMIVSSEVLRVFLAFFVFFNGCIFCFKLQYIFILDICMLRLTLFQGLYSLTDSNKVVICNIHVLYNPNRGEIKLGQASTVFCSRFKMSFYLQFIDVDIFEAQPLVMLILQIKILLFCNTFLFEAV